MVPILDWIFEGIVGWISGITATLMDAVSGLFLEALGTDMTAMEEYFPFVTRAYDVMQVMAYAILILIVLWQTFRSFGGPITEAENPWHLVVRGGLFAFLIGYAKPIFSLCLDIARAPYTSLMDISMTGEDFTFAGIEQALTNGLATILSAASVVGLILILILLISLGWNYFKLLLETVERYVVIGVLCYTSPLAFSMGASKSTSNVFRSWCRMVGSQLLLLVMNVWFLRGFASSVGHFIGSGGALSTGNGSIFLWMFCALAYLKCAQRFDSYLASMGLNVAQSGSSMGMELLMAARVITGAGGGARTAGSVFGRAGGSATATGTGAAATGFAAGFASRFNPNSYVRDAVVDGGTRMGFSGGAGFVGRVFGGMAARNGATLNSQSISSVASRTPGASGTIAGDIADRSLGNFLPHMNGFRLKGTQITGGHISTTATTPDGKKADVDLYSTSQYEKPDAPHSVVTAADGSKWYQVASGEGRGAFYDAPVFGGMNGQPSNDGVHTDVNAVNPEGKAPGAEDLHNAQPVSDAAGQDTGTFSSDQTQDASDLAEGIQRDGMVPGDAELHLPGSDADHAAAETGGDLTSDETGDALQGVGFASGGPAAHPDQTAADGYDETLSGDGNPPPLMQNHEEDQLPEGEAAASPPGELLQPPDIVDGGHQTESGFAPSSEAPVSEVGSITDHFHDAAVQNDGVPGQVGGVPENQEYSNAFADDGETGSNIIQFPAREEAHIMPGTPPESSDSGIGGEHQDAAFSSVPNGSEVFHADASEAEPPGETVFRASPPEADAGSRNASGSGHSASDEERERIFGGSAHTGYAEAPLVAATFPTAPEGTILRTVGDGVIEASSPDGGNTLWYNSAYYQEPDAPHSVMESANGVQWYAMQQEAQAPQFESGTEAASYNQAVFRSFMPGYEGQVANVDGSHCQDGHFEIRNADGSGTVFYDTARYAVPRGEYRIMEDSRGSQWYAISGEAAVDHKPVYENGQPVYEDGKLRTISVETVRYRQTPSRFSQPQKRADIDRKTPRRRQ